MTEDRRTYIRPIFLGIFLTFSGEFLIFWLWGVYLFPQGDLATKILWTATCGVGIGATAGALTTLFVAGRMSGRRAMLSSFAVMFLISGYCVFLCFYIAGHGNWFGANSSPWLFIGGGLALAAPGSWLYGWLLYAPRGQKYLRLIGL